MKNTGYRVIWENNALSDLKDIRQYIAVQAFAPAAAERLSDAITAAANSLSFSPHYRLVDDKRLARLGYRKMVVKSYLIFFRICEDEGTVSILRIIHGSRDWPRVVTKPWL